MGHFVEVSADSLYEAVGLAIARFKADPLIEYEPLGLHEFTVEVREPTTQHVVPRKKFDAWLAREGGSPKDAVARSNVRKALGLE